MTDLYVVATMLASGGKHAQLKALLEPAVALFRKEEGCLGYILLEDRKVEGRFTTFEMWRDEPALAAHMKSHAMKALEPKLKGLLSSPMEQNLLSALVLL